MDYHPASIHYLLGQINTFASINTQGTTVLVIVLCILLFFSFVLSGSEVAFFSLTYKDINLLKTKQSESYKRILNLLEEPKLLLGSLLVANSLINISIIIISNILIGDFFSFEKFNALWLEFVFKVIMVTFLLVLFGEVMPKVLATQNNIRFAKDASTLVEVFYYLFKGIGAWLTKYSDAVEKKLANKNGVYSLEELDHAIDITTDSTASIKEKNILKGIIKFGNITAKQIMKTRVDVNGINKNISYSTLVQQLADLHYSRLPVYEEDLDKVVGIIHTKDLLPYLEYDDSFDWHTLIRPPFFIHEQKLIEDLLKEFQSKRIHFAVVVDEFGGTSGIVTLEDIIEEVIGDIRDEFDDDENAYKKIDEHTYIFEGKTMIHDVCKAMNLDINTFEKVKGDSDSLAGLVLELAGEIPSKGAVVVSGDFKFTVLEIEKNRLLQIQVSIHTLNSN
ncbi:MAG: gliding motility-associated protein GldE [Chitinophagaceae bacterium]